MIAANDPTVKGGAYYPLTVSKLPDITFEVQRCCGYNQDVL